MQKQSSRSFGNIYTAERIIESRIREAKVEYLVKWKNWADKHNTWEPERNILDKELINIFLRKRKRRVKERGKWHILSDEETDSTSRSNLSFKAKKKTRQILTENVISKIGIPKTTKKASPSEAVSLGGINMDPICTSSIGRFLSSPVISTACYETLRSPDGEWHMESRLRKSTLLVATASMSAAANSSGNRSNGRIFDHDPCVSSLVKSPILTDNQCENISTPGMSRPELRLRIPRERLLLNGVYLNSPVNFSRRFSIDYGESVNKMRLWHLPEPVELPRRGVGFSYDDQPVLMHEQMRHPIIQGYDEDSFRDLKRNNSDRSQKSSKLKHSKLWIRHDCKMERRAGEKRQKYTEVSSISNSQEESNWEKASTRYCSSSTESTTSSFNSHESPPRIAPLRIQWTRSESFQSHFNDSTKYLNVRNDYRKSKTDFFIPESSKFTLREINELSITDVTVDNLTITIKESSSPNEFFGLPSFQLIQLTPSERTKLSISANNSLENPMKHENMVQERWISNAPEQIKYSHQNSLPQITIKSGVMMNKIFNDISSVVLRSEESRKIDKNHGLRDVDKNYNLKKNSNLSPSDIKFNLPNVVKKDIYIPLHLLQKKNRRRFLRCIEEPSSIPTSRNSTNTEFSKNSSDGTDSIYAFSADSPTLSDIQPISDHLHRIKPRSGKTAPLISSVPSTKNSALLTSNSHSLPNSIEVSRLHYIIDPIQKTETGSAQYDPVFRHEDLNSITKARQIAAKMHNSNECSDAPMDLSIKR